MNESQTATGRLASFLESLNRGDFADSIEDAYRQLESLLANNTETTFYLKTIYIPSLIAKEKAAGNQIDQLITACKKFYLKHLATTLAEALITHYVSTHENTSLASLIDLILQYQLRQMIDIESAGTNIRFETKGESFSLPLRNIYTTIRLKLVWLTLKKYSALLTRSTTVNALDFPSLIERQHNALNVLMKLDKTDLINEIGLEAFASGQISFSQLQSNRLFSKIYSANEYDDRLFHEYDIPLFPDIKPDKVSFLGDRISLRNEGFGCLPPTIVRIKVENAEFEFGEIKTVLIPDQILDVYLENNIEQIEFIHFLNAQGRNSEVKILFSYHKYGAIFDFIIVVGLVGEWLSKTNRANHDVGTLHPISLQNLSEKDFERLCYWIVDDDSPREFEQALWLNENGGGEKGRDVIAIHKSSRKKYVFQCKRMLHFGPRDIEDELRTFANYIASEPSIKPNVYVLFTSSSITAETQSKGNQIAQSMDMEIEYWPASKIDRLVRRKPNVKDRFWAQLGTTTYEK